jgi:hypothetical protein
MSNHKSNGLVILIIFTLVTGCSSTVDLSPTPTFEIKNTPTIFHIPTPTQTPTRDPNIPFGIDFNVTDEVSQYYSALPQEWLMVDGGIPQYLISLAEYSSFDDIDCTYVDNSSQPPEITASYDRIQIDLFLRLRDASNGEEINSITVSAPTPSYDPCPYLYDPSYDYSKYRTFVNMNDLVVGIYDLVQPIIDDLPAISLEAALSESTEFRPTPTPEPVDYATILSGFCNETTGVCGTYAVVNLPQEEWLPELNNIITEYFGISVEQYIALTQELTSIPDNFNDACFQLTVWSSPDYCLDYFNGISIRRSMCHLTYDLTTRSLSSPDPDCDSTYILLPANGANSGNSIFNISEFPGLGSFTIDFSEEIMRTELEAALSQ